MVKISKKIGIFIDNSSFDPIMTGFRKRGMNIERIDESAELSDYSSIFIDLQYPLEMGYKLISEIATDSKLSRINLFAIISKKSDLQKVTSLQGARISDYIGFGTSFEEVFKKLKYVLSPSGQLIKNYSHLKLNIKIDAFMSHISESGCLISSKVLFRNHSNLEVFSHLINQVTGETNNLFKVSRNIPSTKDDFFTEIDFLNLSNKSRTAIRKMIIGWSLE